MTAAVAAPRRETRTLMIVDDDDLLRESLAESLIASGFRVRAFSTAEAAWTALHQDARPDAIVLDVMMPGMSGPEFRRKQLDDRSVASIPVVAMSGDRSCSSATLDVEAFVAKPLTSTDVVRALELVFRPSRRRQSPKGAKPSRRRRARPRASRSLAGEIRAERREARILRSVSLGVSHVVNNGLQGLMSYVQATSDKNEKHQTYRAVFDAALRCAELLRVFAECTGSGPAGHPSPPQLGAVEAFLIDEWRQLCPAQVELQVTAPHLLRTVHAGPNAMLRMTSELIRNAVEALNGAAGRIHLRASAEQRQLATLRRAFPVVNRRAATWCVLAVEDTGPGILPQDLELIWRPFYSTRFPGRGLGLATVLAQMKALGGLVEAESRSVAGATVRLLFPIGSADDHALRPVRVPAS